jgi:hypothetical protein
MHGLDLDDWPLIERGNFLHYVTLTRHCGDPQDRAKFAVQVRAALTATFALDGRWVDRDQQLESERVADQLRRAGVLVEKALQHCDPVSDWETFIEMLWAGRQRLFLEPAAR